MAATGHSGGPDYYDYTFNDSNIVNGPNYKWDNISSLGTQILPNSNGYSNNIPIGFDFNFYGSNHSSVSIGYDGIIYFNTSNNMNLWPNQLIGSSSIHNFISPCWGYLGTISDGTDAVYYQTKGTAPNRKFIVQWDNVYPLDLSSLKNSSIPYDKKGITFEAILFEGTNDILFQYKNVTFSPDDPMNNVGALDNGGETTVGIEGPTGQGLQYSFNEKVLSPNEAILFKYPQYTGTNLHLSELAPVSKENGSSMTYTFCYHNSGYAPFQNVTIVDHLSDNVSFNSLSNDGNYDPTNKTVTWVIGTVDPEECGCRTLNVSILPEIPEGTVILNDAVITSNLDYEEAHVQTVVIPSILPQYVGVEPTIDEPGITLVSNTDPITFSYQGCDSATGVDINITFENGDNISSPMNNTGQTNKWNYTTVLPYPGNTTVTYKVYGCTQSTVSFNIYVDPSGCIYDNITGKPIANASVWLERWETFSDISGEWKIVPTGEIPPIAQPDKNPYITAEDGIYQWDVIPGLYRVHVEAYGYEPKNSDDVTIPPAVYNLNIGLVPKIAPPVASFICNITSGVKPLTVSFRDTSTGKPTSWKWNFGDGTNSTEENPIHTYNKARQYNVTLIVNNSEGRSKVKQINYITVYDPPIAEFSATPTFGIAPFEVHFTSKSKGSPSSLAWSFGDGNYSTAVNPVNVYNNPGNYTVTLTAYNDVLGISNTTTKTDYIRVKKMKS